MTAYYNEHDKFAAEWLRQLIKAGHIAGSMTFSQENIKRIQMLGFEVRRVFAPRSES